MKIPLSWLQLTHQKTRLLIALAGITFADILMFMQLGFQAALFDSSITLHKTLNAEVFLLSPQTDALGLTKTFSDRRLYESLAIEGVESVSPVYFSFALWKNPVKRNTRNILLIGFNPKDDVFNLPGVINNINKIKLEDYVLFDDKSNDFFGPVAQQFKEGKNIVTEASSHQITVGGLFSLGASFAADGNIITSDTNFLRIVSSRQKGLIDLGVIKIKPDADLNKVLQELREKLPGDVKVFSKAELMDYEQNYWRTSTSIGFIFTLGTTMGFIVGIVIVYQILYTDVSDHLPEYATLKAMGYNDLYFVFLVFQEAILLAILGYIPGVTVATFLYSSTAKATQLPLAMDFAKGSTVFLLTLIMCIVSGIIAVRKLSKADPADIF